MKAYEMAAENKRLREEVERLRHDIERHIAMASELATENERLRAELAEARKPDCLRCRRYHRHGFGEGVCANTLIGEPACINGDGFREADPVRLYKIDAAMAGGEK